MSFDFQLLNNDLQLTVDGKVKTVSNHDKLKQDILKIILTPLGSQKLHPWYGCDVTERVIGNNLPKGLLVEEIQMTLSEGLERLKTLQKSQATYQKVTPSELILSIEEIRVEENPADKRQIFVTVVVLTRQFTQLSETFSIVQ